mgnify:CR=1 FL=1
MKKINPLSKALIVGVVCGLIIWLVSCAVPVAIPLIQNDTPEVIVIEEKEVV